MTTTTEGRRRRSVGAVHRRRQAVVAWLFALPFVAVFSVFMLGPLLASFGMSFSDLTIRDIKSPFAVNFVGLDNFAQVFQD